MSFESFCGGRFWDNNLTINTDNPDFTQCFEHTALIYAPVGFLLLLLPITIANAKGSSGWPLPWTWRMMMKIFLCFLMIVVRLSMLIYNIYLGTTTPLAANEYLYPSLMLIASVALFVLTNGCRRHGMVTSSVLSQTWFLLALLGVVEFRTIIDQYNSPTGTDNTFFGFYTTYYMIVLIQFAISCFADKINPNALGESKNPNPELISGFWHIVTFSYFVPTAVTGYRRALEMKDMWDLRSRDSSQKLVKHWNYYWEPKANRYQYQKECAKEEHLTEASLKKSYGSVPTDGYKKLEPKLPSPPSIVRTIFQCFPWLIYPSILFKLVSDTTQFLNPQLLKLLIAFVQTTSDSVWKGYFYAIALLFVQIFYSLLQNQYFILVYRLGMYIKTVLIASLFNKSIRLSNSAKKHSTIGEIVNLMQVDVQRFMDLTAYVNVVWSAPWQIILSLYFLANELGVAVIAGVVVMVLLIPLNGLLTKTQRRYQVLQMAAKDQRIKLANEILNSMKVLKLYAWEESFEEQLGKIRQIELRSIQKVSYLRAVFTFVWQSAPFLVSSASFGTYVLSDPRNILTPEKAFVSIALFNMLRMPMIAVPTIITLIVQVSAATFAVYVLIDPVNNILTAEKAFVSISLFNILRMPMTMLPVMVTLIVQASVSNKRLRDFLLGDELDTDLVQQLNETDKHVLRIKDGSFSYEKGGTPVLRDVNVNIVKGSLVAVVGEVGSGKSSLVGAMLGQLDKESGSVAMKGSTAYVPQQAWIQNCTLRDNITFAKEFAHKRYNKTVDACALKADLEMLPGGDTTEIGEKGINLSGGQKQRISLARAVYSDADVYFLDDPLSAVDSHVGKHIFDHVISKDGLLAGKTRILVTHGLGYLKNVDNILVMKDGRVSETGTYDELVAAKGAFSEFLETYEQKNLEPEEEKTLDEQHYEQRRNLRMKRQQSTLPSTARLERPLSRAVTSAGRKKSSKSPMDPGFSDTEGGYSSGGERKPSRALSRQLSKLKTLSTEALNAESDELMKRAEEFDEEEEEELEEAAAVGTTLIEAEQVATGQVKLDVYVNYINALGVFPVVFVLIAYAVSNGLQVGSNIWLSAWSNDAATTTVTDANNVTTIIPPMPVGERLGGYVGLGLSQGLSVVLASLLMAYFTLQASTNLHRTLLHNLMRSPMSFFDVTPIGRIVNRIGKDIDTVDNTLPSTLPSWISCVFSVLANIGVIVGATPIFLAVVIPLAILYYFIQRVYVSSSRQLQRLESLTRSPVYSHFQETVQGVSVIRAYQVQDRFMRDSEVKVDVNNTAYYPSVTANRWSGTWLLILGNFVTFFAALFAVISRGTLSGGLAGLSISNAMSITQTLNWAVRMTSDLETNVVSVERIKEYSETPQEAEWTSTRPPSKNWPESGEVEFKEYQMRYREGLDLVLRGINCEITGGEKIGIVGRTGAGKSSLTLALFRLVEAAGGRISIDGLDIAQMGLHELRSKLTIIPQDPVLFTGSLRMNLDPFKRSSDIEIWKALDSSQLKTYVSSLPDKLEYYISEGGENLSVGQRQLVCLARALLRHTKVLILDEATAAVDLETDEFIQTTIRREFKECTILTIAHRLNTIMDSNRVMVLDKGLVVEFEPPEALLSRKHSIFYGMAKDAGLVS